jgi:hypothetical protein
MKTTTLLKLGVLLAAGSLAAHAQGTQVDSWTVWPTESYTSVNATVGDGVLTTDNGSSVSYSTDYIYTFFATPNLTLSTGALDNVASITLEIVIAGGSGGTVFLSEPLLTFGSGVDVASAATVDLTGGQIFGNDASSYTYVWDVSGFTAGEEIGLSWQLNSHAAVGSITLTQSTTAVPEPAAFGAFAGLGVLGLALVRRRNLR